MRKRWLAAGLAVATALGSMTACSKSSDTQEAATGASEAQKGGEPA